MSKSTKFALTRFDLWFNDVTSVIPPVLVLLCVCPYVTNARLKQSDDLKWPWKAWCEVWKILADLRNYRRIVWLRTNSTTKVGIVQHVGSGVFRGSLTFLSQGDCAQRPPNYWDPYVRPIQFDLERPNLVW